MADAYNPYLGAVGVTGDAAGSATSTTPATLPPAGGINVKLPLTGVQPYVADVTRTPQAQLGMIDLNPSRRDPATVGRTLGVLPENYGYDASGNRTSMLGFNHAMWAMLQTIDPLIQKKLVDNPRFWHDRIPRGEFQLHDGVVHQSRIFRAGLQKYYGLDEWEAIDPVPSLSNDPCSFPKHGTTTYGWDQLAWSGMRAAWGSDPICANAFRYLKDAAQQLALILEVGMETGVQMQEVFNRDTYLSKPTDFGRSYAMTCSFKGTAGGSPRYFYDPFVKFGATGSSSTKTASTAYVKKAFIVIDASAEIEPINWRVLDKVHELLKLRCRDAALAYEAGEPRFGLMVNSEDVEASIEGDDQMYKEWLEGRTIAIAKYNMAPKLFKRWAIVSDANQARFKIKHYIQSYVPSTFGGVGAELSGKAVWIAEAVDPFIEDPTHKGINGGPLPIENQDYIDAEIAIAPVFMNNVLTNLFETGGVNLGSGTHFGAYPKMNGQWGWVLNPASERDPFQQTGKFYSLYAIHQKPEPRVRDVISFVYRRCKETLRAKCPIENVRINPNATVATAGVSATEDLKLNVAASSTVAAAVVPAGTLLDVVLAKGYGPMFIGEDRVLKSGTGDDAISVNVKVVDVTAAPYVTVATTAQMTRGSAAVGSVGDDDYVAATPDTIAAFYDTASSTTTATSTAAGVTTLKGKTLTGVTLNKAS